MGTAVVTEKELRRKRLEAAELVNAGRQITQAHYRLVVSCAAFADGPVWIADGEPSAAHWLAPRLDACRSTVRDWIRVGRALRDLRASAASFEKGEISYSKSRALVSLATRENEAELLEIAKSTPAADIGAAFARWSMRNEDQGIIDKRHRRARALRGRIEPDGSGVTTLRLPPLEHQVVTRAIEAQAMRTKLKPEADGSWPSLAQQRADALCELITSNARHRFEVLIHVDQNGCRFPDGTPLTESAVASVLDQASIRLIVHDLDGKPVNASDGRRRPTIRQKRTVTSHQAECSRCGRTDLPVLHHTVEHQHSGRTVTHELEPLCAPCHRLHHSDI